jgi:hypothetical protein
MWERTYTWPNRVSNGVESMKFMFRTWQTFNAERGYWPSATIAVYFCKYLLLIAGIVGFYYFTDSTRWAEWKQWSLGLALLTISAILIISADRAAWCYDWNRGAVIKKQIPRPDHNGRGNSGSVR